ncbi:MAG: hypothetical protein QOG63_963, partial [Thermoleophilaceae bacterium]|nr:hypothetical protein [Thermoleophilaceae bacterium]
IEPERELAGPEDAAELLAAGTLPADVADLLRLPDGA